MTRAIPTHREILQRVRQYRTITRARPPEAQIEQPGPAQESVWAFPRPPEVRDIDVALRVEWCNRTIAETRRGCAIVETAGAPVYYFPPQDVAQDCLIEASHVTLCEWKGAAVHYDLIAEGQTSTHAAFSYPDPLRDLGQGYERIAGWLAFYPSRVDACWVGDEQARPQPGGYYAGWVTSALAGPIKGAPGSEGW